MGNLRKWSSTATGNASVAGGVNTINFAEGQTPGSVNNSAREMMAQIRGVYTPDNWGWVEHSATASVVSQTSFKISGDQTSYWTAGRRWRLKSGSSTRYGAIVSASYTTETTVTVTVDSGSLSASHTLAAVAAIDSNHVPAIGTFVTSSSLATALGAYLTSNSASIAYARLAGANAFTAAQTITAGSGGGISGPASGTWAATIVYNQDSAGLNGLSVQNRWSTSTAIILQVAKGYNGSAAGYYPIFTINGAGESIWTNTGGTELMKLDSSGNFTVGGSAVGRTTLLGTITTTSGASQSLTSLTLTGYNFLRLLFNGVSGSGSGNISVGSLIVSQSPAGSDTLYGFMDIELSTGIGSAALGSSNGATVTAQKVGTTGITTASTSVTVSISAGALDAGSIAVYGIA